jgi:hypothetical protein
MRLNPSFKSLILLITLALAVSKPTYAAYLPRFQLASRKANFTQCKIDIFNHTLEYEPWLIGLDGQRTSNTSEAIGTDYNTCKAYCGTSGSTFHWNNFSTQFTGWLLPFLALTAQLPFESGGTWHNLMSLFISVGAPPLATYSLVLMLLNSRATKRRLDFVFSRLMSNFLEYRPFLEKLNEKIYWTLRMSQQEPFELGNLRHPVPLTIEMQWWTAVYDTLSRRKRWFSASLATQAAWAIIAFGFTWVDAFGSEKVSFRACSL